MEKKTVKEMEGSVCRYDNKERIFKDLQDLMAKEKASINGVPAEGYRSDETLKGRHLVTLKSTPISYPGEADTTQLRLYRDGIIELEIHLYEDDAEIRKKKNYTLQEFQDYYLSLPKEKQEELARKIEE